MWKRRWADELCMHTRQTCSDFLTLSQMGAVSARRSWNRWTNWWPLERLIIMAIRVCQLIYLNANAADEVLLRAMQTMWKPDSRLDFVIAEQITRWAGKKEKRKKQNRKTTWSRRGSKCCSLIGHGCRNNRNRLTAAHPPCPAHVPSAGPAEALCIAHVNSMDISSIRMTLLCKCLEHTLTPFSVLLVVILYKIRKCRESASRCAASLTECKFCT